MASKQNVEFQKREVFLKVYADFDKWLHNLGFRRGSWKENSTILDYNYSHYDNVFESLCAVELYVNETLGYSIRFLRNRDKHEFMAIGTMGCHSKAIPMEEFKEMIKADVIKIRDEKLEELKFFEGIEERVI